MVSYSATVKIGNSNTGGDLEKLTPIGDGPIKVAQMEALNLLEKLNTSGIPGLGNLKPEIEKSETLLAEPVVNALAQDDYRPDHLPSDGQLYARTLPEPYAPTRFFPIATLLSKEQLVKLHIHEALHRALPEKFRTDESVVAQLVLVITDPSATFDNVRAECERILPIQKKQISYRNDLFPSQIGYDLRQFSSASDDSFTLKRAHILKSYLYPFGNEENTFGLGIEFQMIEKNSDIESGPLTLSFRWNAVTGRLFNVDFYGSASLNTLSFQELKNSPYGRDIFSLGITLRRELEYVYFENSLSVRSGGSARQTLGFVEYTYDFGTVLDPSIHFGGITGPFQYGANLSIFLSDHFSVSGGSFPYEKGRFRVVTLGPEFSYRKDSLILTAAGRFILDSTKDADMGTLGMVNEWIGRGGFEVGIGYRY